MLTYRITQVVAFGLYLYVFHSFLHAETATEFWTRLVIVLTATGLGLWAVYEAEDFIDEEEDEWEL